VHTVSRDVEDFPSSVSLQQVMCCAKIPKANCNGMRNEVKKKRKTEIK
jgi:hypothetical protein